MSNFHYGAPHYAAAMQSHPHPSHNHHGRSRRGPRVSSAQNAHRQQQFKAQRSPKELPETPAYSAYIRDFEAAKGFEFEDDEVFCPFHLLTEDDVSLYCIPYRAPFINADALHSFNLFTLPLLPTDHLCHLVLLMLLRCSTKLSQLLSSFPLLLPLTTTTLSSRTR